MSTDTDSCSVGTTVRLKHFKGQRQAQETWCWAALASSITHYFVTKNPEVNTREPKIVAQPQCFFVHRQHGRNTCRDGQYSGSEEFSRFDCRLQGCSTTGWDESGRLDAAIAFVDEPPSAETGLYHRRFFEKARARPMEFDEIKCEIDKGEPIVIRVERFDGTFHLMAIFGYDDSLPGVVLWDPAYGERVVPYNRMQVALGTWTHTLWTQDWIKWLLEHDLNATFSP